MALVITGARQAGVPAPAPSSPQRHAEARHSPQRGRRRNALRHIGRRRHVGRPARRDKDVSSQRRRRRCADRRQRHLVVQVLDPSRSAPAFSRSMGRGACGAFDYRLFHGGVSGSDPATGSCALASLWRPQPPLPETATDHGHPPPEPPPGFCRRVSSIIGPETYGCGSTDRPPIRDDDRHLHERRRYIAHNYGDACLADGVAPDGSSARRR
jgi:hypothetical protein